MKLFLKQIQKKPIFKIIAGNRKRFFVRVQCVCGIKKYVDRNNFKRGKIKSCGCKKAELIRQSKIKHGWAPWGQTKRGRTYRSWTAMRNRCNNPNDSSYHLYGGRGISHCKRWNKFALFLKDMGKCPTEKHSLDRKNTNGNYNKRNCKWSTYEEQANNTRRNIVFKNGKTIRDLSNKSGISYSIIAGRYERGWPEKFLTLKKGSYLRDYI